MTKPVSTCTSCEVLLRGKPRERECPVCGESLKMFGHLRTE